MKLDAKTPIARKTLKAPQASTPIVSVRDLAARYGTVEALLDVSIELLPGRIVGVIGMNGSGKSSLYSAIMGSVKLARGSVQLFGDDPAKARKQNLVSYVPQSEAVDWDFPISVAEVVMTGRYGRRGSRAVRRSRVVEEPRAVPRFPHGGVEPRTARDGVRIGAQMIDWILEPLQFGFMNRALLVTVIAAITCAMLSCWLVQIGWSLMGDAVSHAVLPGVVLSYIFNWPFAVGAFIFGAGAVALQAVGIVLVVAMLITPGATAYLLTKRFDRMLLLSVVVTAFGSIIGVYASYYLDVSTGGAVVLAQAAAFVVAYLFGARGGVLTGMLRERKLIAASAAASTTSTGVSTGSSISA